MYKYRTMKLLIKSITPLHAVTQDGELKDYKQGMKHTINEVMEFDNIKQANEHYANLYKCTEVYIEYKNLSKRMPIVPKSEQNKQK